MAVLRALEHAYGTPDRRAAKGVYRIGRTFLQGALLLGVAGVASRLLGFYRLLLPHLIGPEGVGLYQMAYPVYIVALGLATGGLPLAVSRLVAERVALGDGRGARQVFRLSLGFLGVLGFVGSAVLFAGAPVLARALGRDARATLSLAAVSPALFLVSVMSALRGYFQGLQDMVPTALSQLVEQVVRVATIVVLVVALQGRGVAYQAAGATFGAVTGALAGLLLLIWRYARQPPLPETWRGKRPTAASVLSRLVRLAIPIALAGLLPPLMQFVDLAVVPGRLAARGLAGSQRTSSYGELAGYAVPIVNVPAIFTLSLAVAVIPALAEALTRKAAREAAAKARAALRVAAFVSLPCALVTSLVPKALTYFLYGTTAPGPALQSLAGSIAFLGLAQTAAGALQGVGLTMVPVRTLSWTLAAKAVLTWLLVPPLGVVGAGYATSLSYLLAFVLNAVALSRALPGSLTLRDLVAPLPGLLVLGLAVLALAPLLLHHGVGRLGTLVLLVAASALYLLALVLTGSLGPEELALLPKGEALARLLRRWRLVQ